MDWSGRFTAHLESFGTGTRLARARPGEEPDPVSDLRIAAGQITAQVQGSRRKPYDIWLDLPVFGPADWARAERALADDPACAVPLLDGDLPPGIEEFFAALGLPLLPANAHDLVMECSCPDRSPPCQHLATVLRRLAATFDADPFAALEWRGRSRARLLEHLRRLRGSGPAAARPHTAVPSTAELPLADCLDTFWLAAGRPDPARRPPDPVLPGLGRPAVTIRGRNLADLLHPAYDAFTSW